MLQETLHGFLSGRHEKRELRFLKNHRPKDQVFLVKGGEGWERGGGSLYRTGVSIEGMKQCFPLMMYEFYSDNALYSASFSFTVFIFLLPYFESSVSVLMYI